MDGDTTTQDINYALSTKNHEFGALNTLLLVVLLGMCILAAYLIKQNSFYYLPESAASILVGLMVGGLARAVYPSAEELQFLTFEPEIFYFLLLPPIIFEAGYSMKKRDFFANFWTIGLFAVFGTIVSTFVIGALVYAVGLVGLVEIDTNSPMEPLMFGALLSSVDPVATLSIMGNSDLNCDPLLYTLVFGESVLNDAVAIVLFKTFMVAYDSGEPFSSSTIPSILLNFTGISLGSVFIGVAIGLICSYVCKHTEMHRYPEYEISMLFLFAYGSYSFAESVQLSGIMALFFCGVVLSHYNNYNLSPTSQITAHNIFKSLSSLCEFFVFLFIGMGVCVGKFKNWNFFFIFVSIVICFIARFFNVFPLSAVANLGRTRVISRKMQCVMWFAGLRGAISFALSQNMPGEHKDLYISTTLSVVIFTTIVCGGLTEPFMNKMGMRLTVNSPGGGPAVGVAAEYEKLHADSEADADTVELAGSGGHSSNNNSNSNNSSSSNSSCSSSSSSSSSGLVNGVGGGSSVGGGTETRPSRGADRALNFLQMFDQNYMSPVFGGPAGGFDEDDTDLHSAATVNHHGTGGGLRTADILLHRSVR